LQGQIDPAEDSLRRVLEIRPGYALAHFTLGWIYKRKGNFEEGIFQLEKAIAALPDFAEAYLNLGLCYMGRGMLDRAITLFRRAGEIDINLAEAFFHLGCAYIEKGWLEETISVLTKALKLKPNLAEAHLQLGFAYQKKGMENEGRYEFERALEINENLVAAHNNIAIICARRKELEIALQHIKRASELDVENETVGKNKDIIEKLYLLEEAEIETLEPSRFVPSELIADDFVKDFIWKIPLSDPMASPTSHLSLFSL
jgi:Flp pilus assembly protein TadD